MHCIFGGSLVDKPFLIRFETIWPEIEKRAEEAGDPVELSNIREMIRAKIIENHGSIKLISFHEVRFWKILGGLKIRTYLYDL